MMNTPAPILSNALLSQCDRRIQHGFFTRKGGVSTGVYQSLNVGFGSDDHDKNIIENRYRIAQAIGVQPHNLATLHQIHSADVMTIDNDNMFAWHNQPRQADAMVTQKNNIALGILTADCGPVLFADTRAGVIGAAHAGWRGALKGVVENTVAAMERLGAQRASIIAVVGPSLGPKHYEVTAEFVDTFLQHDKKNASHFHASLKPQHYHFNLWSYILAQLDNAEVHGSCLEQCTYADTQRFFSYRRATHCNAPDYGRQISAIVLKE